jgi:hypothetical protein
MSSLAQLSVLYEDLRIETFALTAEGTEVERLDYLDKNYRVHYFLRRSVATLLEFRGALLRLSKTKEYKTAESVSKKSDKELFDGVKSALRFFQEHHQLLKDIRNAVGGHFTDEAADFATTNVQSDAVGRLEITFDHVRGGGGAKLHYAGELAATAFTKSLSKSKPREQEIADAIKMIRSVMPILRTRCRSLS